MRALISSCSSLWLSREAVLRARELGAAWASVAHMPVLGEEGCWLERSPRRDEGYSPPNGVPRHDPVLLQVYDELGGGRMAGFEGETIECVEIPDDVTYFVDSYCAEWISEQHRTWSAHDDPDGALAGREPFTKDSVFNTG